MHELSWTQIKAEKISSESKVNSLCYQLDILQPILEKNQLQFYMVKYQ